MSPAGSLTVCVAVDVLDHKFAAVVGVGRGEEQRGRDIGAHLHAGAGQQPDRAVDVRAELHFGRRRRSG